MCLGLVVYPKKRWKSHDELEKWLFQLDTEKSTINYKTLKENEQLKKLQIPSTVLETDKRREQNKQIAYYRAPNPKFVKKELKKLIDQFNQQTKEINKKNSVEIVEIIASFANKYVRLHLYLDCNTRTAMALIFGLSIKCGLIPPMIYEPNRFGLYTIKELRKEIINGIKTTKHLIKTGEIKYFCTKKSPNDTCYENGYLFYVKRRHDMYLQKKIFFPMANTNDPDCQYVKGVYKIFAAPFCKKLKQLSVNSNIKKRKSPQKKVPKKNWQLEYYNMRKCSIQ
jgi:prophage maintenance system killer protein